MIELEEDEAREEGKKLLIFCSHNASVSKVVWADLAELANGHFCPDNLGVPGAQTRDLLCVAWP